MSKSILEQMVEQQRIAEGEAGFTDTLERVIYERGLVEVLGLVASAAENVLGAVEENDGRKAAETGNAQVRLLNEAIAGCKRIEVTYEQWRDTYDSRI